LVVPGPGCLYGNWNEDVAVFSFLVICRLGICRPCCGRCVSEVWVQESAQDYTDYKITRTKRYRGTLHCLQICLSESTLASTWSFLITGTCPPTIRWSDVKCSRVLWQLSGVLVKSLRHVSAKFLILRSARLIKFYVSNVKKKQINRWTKSRMYVYSICYVWFWAACLCACFSDELSAWHCSVEGSTRCKYGWLPMSTGVGQSQQSASNLLAFHSRRSSVSDLRYAEQELQHHRWLAVSACQVELRHNHDCGLLATYCNGLCNIRAADYLII